MSTAETPTQMPLNDTELEEIAAQSRLDNVNHVKRKWDRLEHRRRKKQTTLNDHEQMLVNARNNLKRAKIRKRKMQKSKLPESTLKKTPQSATEAEEEEKFWQYKLRKTHAHADDNEEEKDSEISDCVNINGFGQDKARAEEKVVLFDGVSTVNAQDMDALMAEVLQETSHDEQHDGNHDEEQKHCPVPVALAVQVAVPEPTDDIDDLLDEIACATEATNDDDDTKDNDSDINNHENESESSSYWTQPTTAAAAPDTKYDGVIARYLARYQRMENGDPDWTSSECESVVAAAMPQKKKELTEQEVYCFCEAVTAYPGYQEGKISWPCHSWMCHKFVADYYKRKPIPKAGATANWYYDNSAVQRKWVSKSMKAVRKKYPVQIESETRKNKKHNKNKKKHAHNLKKKRRH